MRPLPHPHDDGTPRSTTPGATGPEPGTTPPTAPPGGTEPRRDATPQPDTAAPPEADAPPTLDDAVLRALLDDAAPRTLPGEVVDDEELFGWIAFDRTDEWIRQEYERRYNRHLTDEALAAARDRFTTAPPFMRRPNLAPWRIRPEHGLSYTLFLLMAEARRRMGDELAEREEVRLDAWLRQLRERDLVVDYDPTTKEGFRYVRRRPGLDFDIFRDPRW